MAAALQAASGPGEDTCTAHCSTPTRPQPPWPGDAGNVCLSSSSSSPEDLGVMPSAPRPALLSPGRTAGSRADAGTAKMFPDEPEPLAAPQVNKQIVVEGF